MTTSSDVREEVTCPSKDLILPLNRGRLNGPMRTVTVVFMASALLSVAACAAGPTESSSVPTHAAQDRGRVFADCLADKGFPGTLQPDGSVLSEVAPEQVAQRGAAGEECANVAQDAYPVPVETEQFKKVLYNDELGLVECFRTKGITIGSVPSLQVYLDTYDGPSRWSAWSQVTPDSYPDLFSSEGSELTQLQASCPDPFSLY